MAKTQHLLAVAVTSCLFVLAGCGDKAPAPEALAACMLEHSGPEELREAGQLVAAGKPLPKSLAGECASWSARWSMDDQSWALATKKFAEEASVKADFRAGRYMQIPPEPASDQMRARAAELGALLEQVTATRRDVLQCGMADPQAVGVVAELDSTFVLAATGRYVGVDSFDGARKAAEQIAELALVAGMAAPASPCGAELHTKFRGFAEQWHQFYQGTHPWTPGCKVRTEEKDFVLSCT